LIGATQNQLPQMMSEVEEFCSGASFKEFFQVAASNKNPDFGERWDGSRKKSTSSTS